MVSPKFGLSTYGTTIIIDEGLPPNSGIDYVRVLFLIITGLQSFIVSSLIYSQYRKFSTKPSSTSRRSASTTSASSSGLPFILLLGFLLSNTFRTLHLIDHMYRPVYYHEPKWVYTKYVFTTVEVPLYIDVIIQLLGYSGMKALINGLVSVNGSQTKTLNMSSSSFTCLILYSAQSAVSLIHYTVEPPSNYGIDANFTIAGTVITAFAFGALVLYGFCTGGGKSPATSKSSASGRSEDEVKLLGTPSSSSGPRTRSMNKSGSGTRRRSQTPKRDNE